MALLIAWLWLDYAILSLAGYLYFIVRPAFPEWYRREICGDVDNA